MPMTEAKGGADLVMARFPSLVLVHRVAIGSAVAPWITFLSSFLMPLQFTIVLGAGLSLSSRIARIGPFSIISDRSATPVLSFEITGDVPFSAHDVSDRLRHHGWQVPAYTMPDDATDVAVLRIVVREGFTLDLADSPIKDLRSACDDLATNPPMRSAEHSGFTHQSRHFAFNPC